MKKKMLVMPSMLVLLCLIAAPAPAYPPDDNPPPEWAGGYAQIQAVVDEYARAKQAELAALQQRLRAQESKAGAGAEGQAPLQPQGTPLVPIKGGELACETGFVGAIVFAGLETDEATVWIAEQPQDHQGYLAGKAPIRRLARYPGQLFILAQNPPEPPDDDGKQTWRIIRTGDERQLVVYKGWDLTQLRNGRFADCWVRRQ